MTADEIDQKRRGLETALSEERRQHGIAILDARPFDVGRIHRLEAELEALAGAEAELQRRDRDAADAELAKRRADALAQLRAKETNRLVAISRAEKATRDLVRALREADEAAHDIRTIFLAVDRAPPTAIHRQEMETRLSARIGALLATLPGHHSHFGSMKFGVGIARPDDDWVALERLLMAAEFKKIDE